MPCSIWEPASVNAFQSAPPAEARGDPFSSATKTSRPSFNPLPRPKQGEISVGRLWSTTISCFNPLPRPKQGEMADSFGAKRLAACFNPLPRPKQGEISEAAQERKAHEEFQFAPPAEARGDALESNERVDRVGGFNPLPRPKQGEILAPPGKAFLLPKSFNPLPRPKQGEIRAAAGTRPGIFSFNPLPRPKQGEIVPIRWGNVLFDKVSIRSPGRSKGRFAETISIFHDI